MTDTHRTGNLTKGEVFDAANAIHDRSGNVTQEAVRAECGNRGSYATLNKHLKAWREENDAITSRISRELTPELERHSLDLIAQISELMSQRADERCAQLEAWHKATMDMKEEALNEACAEADQYHALLADAEARTTELLLAIDASQETNDRHVADAKTQSENIRNLEVNREINLLRTQQDQQQISFLEAKLNQALISAGHFEGVASRLKEQLSEQNKQLAESSRAIGSYEECLVRADDKEAQLRARNKHLSKRCAGLEMAQSVLVGTSQICLPKPTRRDSKFAA